MRPAFRALAVVLALGILGTLLPAVASAHGIGGIVPDLPVAGAHARGPAVPLRGLAAHIPLAHASALNYEGGPVLHWNRTHVVFWAPAGTTLAFPAGYETLIERFLGQVAADSHHATNVYGLSGQYTDASGPAAYDSTYGGAVLAADPLPASACSEPSSGPTGWSLCLTDAQLQDELTRVVALHHLSAGPNDVYFLVLPDGLATCTDASSQSCALGGPDTGFCGYHSQTGAGLLYAVIPYNAVPGHCQSDNPRPNGNPADPAISTISHEHNETVTDPETYNSWIDANGNENGDLCISQFGPAVGGSGTSAWNEVVAGGHYWLQEEWSNEDGSCQPRDETDPVAIAGGASDRAGTPIAVGAHASDPDGRIVAYSWSFGDGASGQRRALAHAYARAGTYRIVLRVTDSAGNWSFATRTVRVLAAAAGEPRRHPVRIVKPR